MTSISPFSAQMMRLYKCAILTFSSSIYFFPQSHHINFLSIKAVQEVTFRKYIYCLLRFLFCSLNCFKSCSFLVLILPWGREEHQTGQDCAMWQMFLHRKLVLGEKRYHLWCHFLNTHSSCRLFFFNPKQVLCRSIHFQKMCEYIIDAFSAQNTDFINVFVHY